MLSLEDRAYSRVPSVAASDRQGARAAKRNSRDGGQYLPRGRHLGRSCTDLDSVVK